MENIKVFETIGDLSNQLGQFICELSNSDHVVNLVLSGGSTPAYIFDYLTTNFNDRIQWDKINFFWADERCVPADHPESNFKMTNEKMLLPLGIKEDHIFRIKGENDPEKEADRYSEIILKTVGRINHVPSFDLILLGMGVDGHTASIFPDQLSLLRSDKICKVATHPDSGQKRITITGNVINNAKQIIFLVTGVSKKYIIRDVLKDSGKWMNYPAACIQPISGKIQWFLDKKAASLVY